VTEHHPAEPEDDQDGRADLPDPDSSHGSDLDTRIGTGDDRPDPGADDIDR
jgi:hypothetical protein